MKLFWDNGNEKIVSNKWPDEDWDMYKFCESQGYLVKDIMHLISEGREAALNRDQFRKKCQDDWQAMDFSKEINDKNLPSS